MIEEESSKTFYTNKSENISGLQYIVVNCRSKTWGWLQIAKTSNAMQLQDT